MSQTFEQKLTAVLAREIEGFDRLVSCQRLTAGASLESYRVTLIVGNDEHRYALRRYSGSDGDQSMGSIGLPAEAAVLRQVRSCDVPVPEVICELAETDDLGQGYLMEWLDGETLGHRINRKPEFASIRPRLAYRCGEILGRIHGVNLDSADLRDVLPALLTSDLVDEQWQRYCDLNVPMPMIDYTWRWLKENLPENSRQGLVHGDFRNGNLMVTPAGVAAVLDWELARIGDPLADLGWLCANAWRFGSSDLRVGGFGDVDQLLAGYAAGSGIEVSLDELHFWEVYACFSWSIITLCMCDAWRRGEAPGPERPVIGRRSSEAQMDCVNLLIPGEHTLPDIDVDLQSGTQLPGSPEMLQSVVDLLVAQAETTQDKRSAFLMRVAANSLGIVQREGLHGGELSAAECGRLEVLLGASGDADDLRWQLVQQLRGGLDLASTGLAEHLRQTVAGQLAVDNPGYSALS